MSIQNQNKARLAKKESSRKYRELESEKRYAKQAKPTFYKGYSDGKHQAQELGNETIDVDGLITNGAISIGQAIQKTSNFVDAMPRSISETTETTTTARGKLAYCYLSKMRKRADTSQPWIEMWQVYVGGFGQKNILVKEIPVKHLTKNLNIVVAPFAAVDFRDKWYVGVAWKYGSGSTNVEYGYAYLSENGNKAKTEWEITDISTVINQQYPGLLPQIELEFSYVGFGVWVQQFKVDFYYNIVYGDGTPDQPAFGSGTSTTYPRIQYACLYRNQNNLLKIDYFTQTGQRFQPDSAFLTFSTSASGKAPLTNINAPLTSFYSDFANETETAIVSQQNSTINRFLRVSKDAKKIVITKIDYFETTEAPILSKKQQYVQTKKSYDRQVNSTGAPVEQVALIAGNSPLKIYKETPSSSSFVGFDYTLIESPLVFTSITLINSVFSHLFTDVYSNFNVVVDAEKLLNRRYLNSVVSGTTNGIQNRLLKIFPELNGGASLDNLESKKQSAQVYIYDSNFSTLQRTVKVSNINKIEYAMSRKDEATGILEALDYIFCNASYNAGA